MVMVFKWINREIGISLTTYSALTSFVVLPVLYSRINIGLSKGNMSMTGCAVPNMEEIAFIVIAPKCALKLSGTESSLSPALRNINPYSKLSMIVIPKRPINAAMSVHCAYGNRSSSE